MHHHLATRWLKETKNHSNTYFIFIMNGVTRMCGGSARENLGRAVCLIDISGRVIIA